MNSREEIFRGKVEFDLIVNGEYKDRIKNGLLAYDAVDSGNLVILSQGINPELMAAVAMSLTHWLLEHGHVKLLSNLLDEMVKSFGLDEES